MPVAHTIIVSDIHLGSDLSRVNELIDVLDSWVFERLILLGDIFDNLDFKRLSGLHWGFLSHIREVSRKREVVWIEGNHDEGLLELAPYILGVKACREYTWDYNGKRYLAMHGHQFDHPVIRNGRITNLACLIHRFTQRIDTKGYVLSRYLQRKSTTWLRLSKKVAYNAIRYAIAKGVSYVFCGHTHQAMSVFTEDVHYYNSGCWTDTPASYISIGGDGIKLHEIK